MGVGAPCQAFAEYQNRFHKNSKFLIVSEEEISVTKVSMVNLPHPSRERCRNMVQWCQMGYHNKPTTNLYRTKKKSLPVL